MKKLTNKPHRISLKILRPFDSNDFLSTTLPFQQYIHDAFYDGCGTLKTCFGVQYRCVEQRSCTAAGTVTFVDGRYIFEIMTNNGRFHDRH